MASKTPSRTSRGLCIAAFLIGIALSGFFDGILLHQILQWHHVLSLVPGETFRDLRAQVYADGLFHIAIYCVSLAGLWALWRARAQLTHPGATAQLLGSAMIGFGSWNVIDVGLFHWLIGIHRVRLNVSNPMAYDLAWFFGLGILPAIIGWAILRRVRSIAVSRRSTVGRGAAVGLVLALSAAVPISNRAPSDTSSLIMFRPDIGPAGAINAILGSGGEIIGIDPEGMFAVASLPPASSRLRLYRRGAILVTASPALTGCLAFSGRVER